jgi:hypothetical protein
MKYHSRTQNFSRRLLHKIIISNEVGDSCGQGVELSIILYHRSNFSESCYVAGVIFALDSKVCNHCAQSHMYMFRLNREEIHFANKLTASRISRLLPE